jgi:hypothetical protein
MTKLSKTAVLLLLTIVLYTAGCNKDVVKVIDPNTPGYWGRDSARLVGAWVYDSMHQVARKNGNVVYDTVYHFGAGTSFNLMSDKHFSGYINRAVAGTFFYGDSLLTTTDTIHYSSAIYKVTHLTDHLMVYQSVDSTGQAPYSSVQYTYSLSK